MKFLNQLGKPLYFTKTKIKLKIIPLNILSQVTLHENLFPTICKFNCKVTWTNIKK